MHIICDKFDVPWCTEYNTLSSLEGGVASEHAPLLRLGMASQQSLSTGVASDSEDQD